MCCHRNVGGKSRFTTNFGGTHTSRGTLQMSEDIILKSKQNNDLNSGFTSYFNDKENLLAATVYINEYKN